MKHLGDADWKIGEQLTLFSVIPAIKFDLVSGLPVTYYLNFTDSMFISATIIIAKIFYNLNNHNHIFNSYKIINIISVVLTIMLLIKFIFIVLFIYFINIFIISLIVFVLLDF